jgi:hypothetical protein
MLYARVLNLRVDFEAQPTLLTNNEIILSSEVRIMLSNKIKKVVWMSITSLFVASSFSCIDSRIIKDDAEFTRDMQKVKQGMTYKDIRFLLGSPTVILHSKVKDLEKYKKMDPKKIPVYIFETNHDSRTKSGEIDWLYVHYDQKSSDYGFPVYSFDLNTGRLIRVSRRVYEGS